MQRRSAPRESTIGIISILLIYLSLIILILVFAQQLLSEVSRGTILGRFLFIPLAILLPLSLVVGVGYNIIRLVRERKKGLPGSRFKVKLVIFFTFISLLASTPQGVLSISFIRTTMNSWFSNQLHDALQGGLDIAMEYNRSTLHNLTEFSNSEILPRLIREEFENPEQLWGSLQSLYPQLDAVQSFNEEGETLFFKGDETARMDRMPPTTTVGILPRIKTGETSLVRTRTLIPIIAERGRSETISMVSSVILPPQFDHKAKLITDALQMFSQYYEFQNTFLLAILVFYSLFSFPILLLSILTGFILSDEITRPVVHLEEAIQRVISGDYSFRIMSRTGDELSILVNSFNTMISELDQSRTKLRQTEKVTAWQEIAQRMAHEIKNPLTPITLSAQRIQRAYQKNSPRLEEVINSSVSSITQEIDHLTELLAEFRDFARLPEPHFEKTDIKELLLSVLDTYKPQYPGVETFTEHLHNIQVVLDRHQMNRVFSNLIKNSFESIKSEKGSISIITDLVRKGHTYYCRIQIEDTGGGIPRELEQKVFQPYFTTKEGGTGLGLPIVERIVSDHQGQIWFETEQNVGTTFYLDLPTEQI